MLPSSLTPLLLAFLFLLGGLPSQGLQRASNVVISTSTTRNGVTTESTSTRSIGTGNYGWGLFRPIQLLGNNTPRLVPMPAPAPFPAEGEGESKNKVTSTSSSSSSSSSSATATSSSSASGSGTTSASSSADSKGGENAKAQSVAVAKDGADVTASSEAVGSDGGSAIASTVAVGEGDVTVNESTTAVSENGSDVIVVRFVKKIEDGGSRKQLKKELVQELEELLPGKEFSETLSEGLQAEAARSLYISAAEDMLKNLGCDGFKLLFDGNTLPIASALGAGEKVNSCIFQACPGGCCSSIDVDSCSCRRGVCEWSKPKSLKSKEAPSFFSCRRCRKSDDSCMCM